MERRVPRSTVPGERAAATQPFSTGMPSFDGPPLRERAMWGLTPFDQAWCRIAFRRKRSAGTLTPPGLDRPALIHPGHGGGLNWGRVRVEQRPGIMVVKSKRLDLKSVV